MDVQNIVYAAVCLDIIWTQNPIMPTIIIKLVTLHMLWKTPHHHTVEWLEKQTDVVPLKIKSYRMLFGHEVLTQKDMQLLYIETIHTNSISYHQFIIRKTLDILFSSSFWDTLATPWCMCFIIFMMQYSHKINYSDVITMAS